jgi:cell division protein FtsB
VSRARVTLLVLLVAALFALLGGEYSTWDWYQLHREKDREQERIRELTRLTDSLERAALAVETDPAVQERLARELYGMMRDGEYGYSIVPDSTSGDRKGRP